MDHIYVTLPSDSSVYCFPNNTIANFRTKLATPIEVEPGRSKIGLVDISYPNPSPALTLQSSRDLNVPCHQKLSKALLLSKTKRIFFKKEVFAFRTKTLKPLLVRLKVLLHALTGCVFSVAFADYTRNTSPLQEKITTIKLKNTE
jgi:hypothetical protein